MIRRVMKRLVLAAMAVLTITLVTVPPAKAATIYDVTYNPENGWNVGSGWCYPTRPVTQGPWTNHCVFAIPLGFMTDGTKQLIIGRTTCFPDPNKVYGAEVRTYSGKWGFQWLASLMVTNAGFTRTLSSSQNPWHAEATHLYVSMPSPTTYDECGLRIRLKKYI